MKNPLSRLPWFIGAPGFLGAVLVAAVVSNYLGADYFKRTRLDEANPLAGIGSAAESSAGTVLLSGQVRDGEPGHRGAGEAKLIRGADGALSLRLENFSVTNGPDLFVVLSTSPDGYAAEGAFNLGSLKATDGNLNYAIASGTDLAKFKSVVIWCRQFDVDFAVATLGPTSVTGATPASNQPAAQAAQPSPTPAPTGATPPPAATASQTAASQSAPTQTPAPLAPATPTPSSAPGPQLVAQGAFRDGEPGHRGSGIAKLGRDATGKPVLVFENFSVTNGPDLRVILGTSANGGGQGLDLGKLKATDGTFTYAIPDGTELSQFKSVTIWCASFPTVFAVATFGA